MENDMGDYTLYSDDDLYVPESEDIAVSVLLLLGIVPILPALGWIILSFYCKHWKIIPVSFSFVSLLVTDALQLIASPFIVETVLTGVPCWHAHWWCITVYTLFSVSRFCGLFFQITVALDNIWSLKSHLQQVDSLLVRRWCSLFVPVSVYIVNNSDMVTFLMNTGVWFIYPLFTCLAHIFDMNYLFYYVLNTLFGLGAVVTVAAACVITFITVPAVNPTKKQCQRLKVLAVAMFTFMILYVPEFLYWIIQHHRTAWMQGFSHVVHYLPCLRPITDCVLCWLVYKDRVCSRDQQTDLERNSSILDSSHHVPSLFEKTSEV
uniref:uncharacterized protein LOC124007795 n=1 Tax=Oncorhynchus gorbuscha TaxID=8017 RepID=UPI001EAE855F|nr:uncharacterized protein LOC124007795 [Oncorhynchus gorbuscha]XP_046174516.1 uncharacterized protein LOC124007795 [Oncorhynchus gorbuscha]XP_046174517.1 uncharacterized protein LOC124007795 [Oncorhynchus gorbuscha]XP_046174518.1 uncharacterized protein LOC124007795 [Oncorhynchus gorbuscha]XP_046174519.1 uncharacterized protein LOC124007795 [Oncorhynchus gorbuscha]XP_046174520.1 uncharacterized protein LOC124007795 [Oncorhynchus gorbuscha]